MSRFTRLFVVPACAGLTMISGAHAQHLTVQVGTLASPPTPLVEHTNIWRWHKGTNAPAAGWKTDTDVSLDATWGGGPGGFGYSDDTANETNQCRTILSDMRGTTAANYSTFYIRKTFTIDSEVDTNRHIQLTMDWDDGFIAWLDGVYITNRLVTGAPAEPLYTAVSSANHESSRGTSGGAAETYDLGAVGTRTGTHVLAVMGLNGNKSTSSDFILLADLSLTAPTNAGAIPNNGLYALTGTNSVVLTGSNTMAGSSRVTINGDEAAFNSGAGTWSKTQALQPGLTRLFIAALDSGGNLLSNRTQDIIYETSRINAGGTLSSSLLASNRGTVLYVTNSIVVPTNITFEVANGAVVLVNSGQSILTRPGGRIYVHGTFAERVFFNINGAASALWGPLTATGTNASIEIKFADISHAQVSATTNAYGLIEDSELHDFDPGSGAGTLGRPLMMCNFARLFEARRNQYRNYYETLVRNGVIQIEECLFEEITGDALDFDSAQPGSFVRRCTFRHGTLGNVDAVDIGPADLPGSTDTRIEDCLMWNFPFDKGVSVGDGGSSHGIIVSNCLIYGCNAGVMSKDLCDVSVRNCTIVENTSGLTNYNKANPASPTGGGITTNSYNNIVWNNITTIGMANNGQLYADHNDLGKTNWPGTGNFDANPLFVDAARRNYRLQAGSPCRGAGRDGADLGVTYPLGGIPLRPLNLAVVASGTNAPVLNWIDDSQNEDGVVVQRSTDAINWQIIATLPAEATNHSDGTAVLGQKYYYRVQHTNYVAASLFSNIASGTRQPAILYIGGAISANTIWNAGATVVVTSSVTVAVGATLTIEPCATVLFSQGASLTVNGLLLAEGTPECRILLKPNVGATTWNTLDLFGTGTHRLRYVDIVDSTGNIDATSTAIYLQSIWWTNTLGNNLSQLLDMVGTAVTLLDSYIPGGAGNEPVHFSNMPANGYALFQGNIFGAPAGYNDSIDFTGGNRPGPIVQFIDNIFLGAVDDCVDLDSTDAHIEGNIFLNIHQDAARSSTANALASGEGSGTSELVVVRNIFYNCDHALLLKDMGSAVFENNTVVTIQTNQYAASRAAYVQFGEPHRGVPGARGILMNGNILWDLRSVTPFLAFTNGTMFMVANDNVIQGTNMMFGGNSTNDPMFVNWASGITHLNIKSNLALLPGSPAIGTGPNGLDRGALVPGGASIWGEPAGTSTNTAATLTVAGPGIYAYRWKLNDGPWSAEVPLTTNILITATMFSNAVPITLSGLSNGTYTVYVIGKNSAGSWQSTNSPTVSRTWTVGSGSGDSDNDGMPDDWETAHGLVVGVNDADGDPDGDGLTNLQEYLAGSDPQGFNSPLRLESFASSGNDFRFSFLAGSNQSYTVQYRPSFSTGSWLRLQDFTAVTTNRTLNITNVESDAMRFYRVVTPLVPPGQ